MKLVSLRGDGSDYLGIMVKDGVVNAAGTYSSNFADAATGLADMSAFLNGGVAASTAARRVIDLALATPDKAEWSTDPLAAAIPRPPKLLCLAGNYADHIREGGEEAPEKATTTPRVFMKPPSTTVIATGDAIVVPSNAGSIDWEGELGVVIDKRGKNISAVDGLDHVAGYTIVNDISERSLVVPDGRTERDGDGWFDWLNGKWQDTFAPMGPCLVTTDEIPDPQVLHLTTRVNGKVKQDANTAQMIFSCAELVSWASRLVTLEPGDVISTGTPSGVGSARGERLVDGDVVEVEIDGIGVLSNPVVDEK
jgi:2-keto-4-pentenoate hydratase/2-oxohepta-3-ene-1,7-dioic acid hydratase in catechol pathway